MSQGHFIRVFRDRLGLSPAAYLARKKLVWAARELLLTKRRIIDIAFDTDFQSQEAFHRAFERLFGMTPAAYRKNGIAEEGYAAVNSPSREIVYEPPIRCLPEITLTGYSLVLKSPSAEENFHKTKECFERFFHQAQEITGEVKPSLHGYCWIADPGTPPHYLFGVKKMAQKSIKGMEERTIPARRWAEFITPLEGLVRICDYAKSRWLASSGQRLAAQETFETFEIRDKGLVGISRLPLGSG